MQKQKELTFYNISRHVVRSNCGSSFPEAGLFCTYSISFLLKQSCDNNIVNCIQMIYTEVLCCLEHHFKAYTRIKNKTLYRELIFYTFSSFNVAAITPPTRLKMQKLILVFALFKNILHKKSLTREFKSLIILKNF